MWDFVKNFVSQRIVTRFTLFVIFVAILLQSVNMVLRQTVLCVKEFCDLCGFGCEIFRDLCGGKGCFWILRIFGE